MVLNVAHALELLLKERLRRVHPAFVWRNVDKYPSTGAATVDTGTAVSRLVRIAEVEFPEEALNTIHRARKLRNEIEHFETTINLPQTKAIAGQLFAFIADFSDHELGIDLAAQLGPGYWRPLSGVEKFWRFHAVATEQQVAQEEDERGIVECTACMKKTFRASTGKCALCGYEEQAEMCILCERWVLGGWPAEQGNVCWDCGQEATFRVELLHGSLGSTTSTIQRRTGASLEALISSEGAGVVWMTLLDRPSEGKGQR